MLFVFQVDYNFTPDSVHDCSLSIVRRPESQECVLTCFHFIFSCFQSRCANVGQPLQCLTS